MACLEKNNIRHWFTLMMTILFTDKICYGASSLIYCLQIKLFLALVKSRVGYVMKHIFIRSPHFTCLKLSCVWSHLHWIWFYWVSNCLRWCWCRCCSNVLSTWSLSGISVWNADSQFYTHTCLVKLSAYPIIFDLDLIGRQTEIHESTRKNSNQGRVRVTIDLENRPARNVHDSSL